MLRTGQISMAELINDVVDDHRKELFRELVVSGTIPKDSTDPLQLVNNVGTDMLSYQSSLHCKRMMRTNNSLIYERSSARKSTWWFTGNS